MRPFDGIDELVEFKAATLVLVTVDKCKPQAICERAFGLYVTCGSRRAEWRLRIVDHHLEGGFREARVVTLRTSMKVPGTFEASARDDADRAPPRPPHLPHSI